MDFQPSEKAQELSALMWAFLNDRVLPAEAEYDAYRASVGQDDFTLPPVVEELKNEARELGLWNLFLPEFSGLTNVEYAQPPTGPNPLPTQPLLDIMSLIGPKKGL